MGGLVVPSAPQRIWPLPEMPAPKFATVRDESLYSVGPRQHRFAEVWLRKPLLRWQKIVTDVAGERLPDGRARYKLVIVTVQRQAGKTHMDLVVNGERCLTRPGFRAFYTAQTGKEARKSFVKLYDNQVKGTPLEKVTAIRRGNSVTDLTFLNQSVMAAEPPTEEAGHGDQSDRYTIDEGWAHSKEEGAALLQAIGPTQVTRPDGQIWIISAGGTAASTWLAELVARGREGDPEICYFEWAIPDDLALDDLAAIAEHHPAYGELVDVHAIRELRSLFPDDDAAFARAAGNRWTEVIGGTISAGLWESVQHSAPIPETAPVGYGAARATDGTHVAVVAAAQVDDTIVCEVLDVMPAYGAAKHVEGWASDGPLVVGAGGASAALADDLVVRNNRELLPFTGRDYSATCSYVLDALPHKAIRFRPHPALDDAVKIAGKRAVDGGGWVWAAIAPGAQLAVLEAATKAVYALRHRPAEPTGKPEIYTGAA